MVVGRLYIMLRISGYFSSKRMITRIEMTGIKSVSVLTGGHEVWKASDRCMQVGIALNDHKLETLLTGKTPMYFAPVFRHERLEIQAHQSRRQGL